MLTKLFTAIGIVCGGAAYGQDPEGSNRQKRPWYVPDAALVQFAGNMGLLSAGPGYDLFHGKASADLLYGLVPKYEGETTQHLLTAKIAYRPFRVVVGEYLSFTPLQAGAAISYYFGNQYNITWEGYPKGYYGFPTRLRLLAFAGPAVNYHPGQRRTIKKLSLYSELGTSDLGFVSWIRDREFSAWEVVNISLGLRVSF